MSKPRLILASGSPRRRELLGLLGIPFEVVTSGVDESPGAEETDVDFVMRAARDKGLEVAARIADSVILSADTIVSVDGEILGKPSDAGDAARMLEQLSGRPHSVYTGVFAVHSSSRIQHGGMEHTRVWFNALDRATIDDYLGREDVLDKAGAYGIQGFASVFIPRIEGNYPNVMGLPLPLTWDLLRRHGLMS
jgi:septum formation protein